VSGPDPLLALAWETRARAHAPYSRWAVGAAVEDAAGARFGGCNVENASYGLTMCAERVALYAARAQGAGEIRRVVVVAHTEALPSPCGACRQVMLELAPQAEVLVANQHGRTARHRVADLLPAAFEAGAIDEARE